MKLSFIDNTSVKGHSALCGGVGWTKVQKSNCLYSVADDFKILRWNIDCTVHSVTYDFSASDTESKVPQFCTTMDISPVIPGRAVSESIALGFSDGSIRLVNGNGKEERRIEGAHAGAVVAMRWNVDGTALASCGEDGTVRIWSRGGVARTSFPPLPSTAYAVAWSPDSESLALSLGGKIMIRPILGGANKKIVQWKAHEGVALALDWSPVNKMILSGGEDGRFRVFDALGRQQFASPIQLDTAITAVAWSPSGRTFAIGSHNHLRLCDSLGWTLSSTDLVNGVGNGVGSFLPSGFGSVSKISFSPDGGQVAAACASGQVLLAHVSVESASWDTATAVVDSAKGEILFRDLSARTDMKIKESERVRGLWVGHGRLVVLLPTQLKVYSSQSNVHQAIEEIDEPAFFAILAPTMYALIDTAGVHLRSYDCRHICSLQFGAGTPRTDLLDERSISLSKDTVAVLDPINPRILRIFDANSGRPIVLGEASNLSTDVNSGGNLLNNSGTVAKTGLHSSITQYTHSCPISVVALSQNGGPNYRRVAFIDKNREVYLSVAHAGDVFAPIRIGSVAASIAWHATTGQLAAVSPDGKVKVWNYPPAANIDISLLEATCSTVSVSESFAKAAACANAVASADGFGETAASSGSTLTVRGDDNIRIESFANSVVTVRFQDGTKVCAMLAAHMLVLFQVFERGDWGKALRLCRFLKDPAAWATLAVMSISERDLDTAKHALAALGDLPRVKLIQNALNVQANFLTGPAGTLAAIMAHADLSLLCRRPVDGANGFLANGGSIYRAVKTLIKAHEWEAALTLALKKKSHIDTVLAYRNRFMTALHGSSKYQEPLESFKQLKSHFGEIDWDTIKAKIRTEKLQIFGNVKPNAPPAVKSMVTVPSVVQSDLNKSAGNMNEQNIENNSGNGLIGLTSAFSN